MLFFIQLERKELHILKCYTPVPTITRDRVQKLSQDLEAVPANKNPIPRINTYFKNYFNILQKDYLFPNNQKRLRLFYLFLQPFYQIILETQGDYATLDQVLFLIDILIQWFKEGLNKYRDNKEFSTRIQKGQETLNKYYSKTNTLALYVIALILHPKRRLTYLRTNQKAK